MSNPEQRRRLILNAIVADYVLDGEPVGSRRLVDELDLGVSAATVRADMAVLEAQGYITQPHTSAGRVPTDLGYRHFVDTNAEAGQLGPEHAATLDGLMLGSTDIEELLRRASDVLSRLTRCAAIIAAPRLNRTRLRHLELVPLAGSSVLAIIIVDTGQVRRRVLSLERAVPEHDLQRARHAINDAAGDLVLNHTAEVVAGLSPGAPPQLRALLDAVADALAEESSGEVPGDRVIVGGGATLAASGHFDRVEQVSTLYELLEQQVVMLEMLRGTLAQGDPAVRIGAEIPLVELAAFSVVASGYDLDGDRVGSVGVLGPTRMDYPRTLAAVEAVASSIERALVELTTPAG